MSSPERALGSSITSPRARDRRPPIRRTNPPGEVRPPRPAARRPSCPRRQSRWLTVYEVTELRLSVPRGQAPPPPPRSRRGTPRSTLEEEVSAARFTDLAHSSDDQVVERKSQTIHHEAQRRQRVRARNPREVGKRQETTGCVGKPYPQVRGLIRPFLQVTDPGGFGLLIRRLWVRVPPPEPPTRRNLADLTRGCESRHRSSSPRRHSRCFPTTFAGLGKSSRSANDLAHPLNGSRRGSGRCRPCAASPARPGREPRTTQVPAEGP